MTQRVIFRCRSRSCRHVWAFDYPEKSIGNEYFRRAGDRAEVRFPKTDAFLGCPKCGAKKPHFGQVKGAFSDQKCDERCTQAHGLDCKCSCGGVNHGRDFVCEVAA